MTIDINRLKSLVPPLETSYRICSEEAKAYRLGLPNISDEREFQWAELIIPRDFPHDQARIILSPDTILRIPHVEYNGALCIEEIGPGRGFSPEERIHYLLHDFYNEFLSSWISGDLDDDFAKEPLHYWDIYVSRFRGRHDPIREIWTVDKAPKRASIREGTLLLPAGIVIVDNMRLQTSHRLAHSLGKQASQRIRVSIADIPIEYPLTPSTWPSNLRELELLVAARFEQNKQYLFQTNLRKRAKGVHRIVLLRNDYYGFAYFLPGGPPIPVGKGTERRAYPSRKSPQPISVSRLDASWTIARDQSPSIDVRQEQKVVVFGAGALGSPVVEHLARAGIGSITLVDPEIIEPANLGRHLLGTESIRMPKALAVAKRCNNGFHASQVKPAVMSAERWLTENGIDDVSLLLDLTGEFNVRLFLDRIRSKNKCPLLVGWMEPYVAAAHVCYLTSETTWMLEGSDALEQLQAVEWPEDVIQSEPGCNSKFQSYTASAAAYAVALVTEQALQVLEDKPDQARVTSWVRGKKYLRQHKEGLELKHWAKIADSHNGMIIERSFP
ncbi:ThiF family adenylyltransferase [Salinivibrio sp. ES.052]|uniref:ThiF family adenylyltransferase n=1 Tax=Salinivibrio sp. ES.052 TaxID=1882823 RepID=UPI00092A2A46|nr:ThiF family adenylyltransferase [Salinivibrio sp. ES.052]SIO33289.1 ThiF family protein [Salinivibrio sp. ES.052]